MERGIITISKNGTVAMLSAPVWMTQLEMADAFCVFGLTYARQYTVIYKNNELLENDTMRYIRQTDRISCDVYSLEVVIAVAFRLRSRESLAFRQFIIYRLYRRKEKPACFFFSLPGYGKRTLRN